MIKRIIAIVSLLASLFILWLWDVGSHGHMQFRPKMVEDWIMLMAFVAFLAVFIIITFRRNFKR